LIAAPVIVLALVAAIFLFVQQQGSGTTVLAQPQAAAAPAGEVAGYPAGINSQSQDKKYPLVMANSTGEFRFPVAAFADGKARFFSTSLPDGKSLSFFVIRSDDGVLRAALDSCDVCYPARKGYHQEGDLLVCNNCGQRFASAKINEVKGGCNPASLTRTVEGETLVIRLSDMQNDNRAANGQPLF
jgi:uncharacterized membrane protein